MRGLVELGDERPSCKRWWHAELLRPMGHTLMEIRVPLAAYIVAQADGLQVVEVT